MRWLAQLSSGELFALVSAVLGLLLALRVYLKLRNITAGRLQALAKRHRFDAVPTQSPIDKPSVEAKRAAEERIAAQFTVSRRTVVPLILTMTALVAALPWLQDMNAVFVTLLATALTVLLGMAARPFVENAIAGLLLSSSKLIRVGDTVTCNGLYGTIEDITLTHTTLKVWDWRRHIFPNSVMLSSSLMNHSLIDLWEWAVVEFFVGYESDLDEVRALAIEAAKASKHFYSQSKEEPKVWVMELMPTGYKCWVAGWTSTPSDAWSFKSDVRERLIKELAARKIPTHVHSHFVREESA